MRRLEYAPSRTPEGPTPSSRPRWALAGAAEARASGRARARDFRIFAFFMGGFLRRGGRLRIVGDGGGFANAVPAVRRPARAGGRAGPSWSGHGLSCGEVVRRGDPEAGIKPRAPRADEFDMSAEPIGGGAQGGSGTSPDQRASARRNVAVPCRLVILTPEIEGTTRDASSSGLLFTTNGELRVEVELEEDGRTVRRTGRLSRVQRLNAEESAIAVELDEPTA